jgi:hypothetical protein
VAGNYEGRMVFYPSSGAMWARDTTIQVVALPSTTGLPIIGAMGRSAAFDTPQFNWYGPAPQNPCYNFWNKFTGSNYAHMQADLVAQRIYVLSATGNLGGQNRLIFYGVRVP